MKFTTSTRITEDLLAEGVEGVNLYRVTWILKTRDIPSFGKGGSAYLYPLSARAAVKTVIKQLNAKAAARKSRLAPQSAA